jgi:hypothetical protein
MLTLAQATHLSLSVCRLTTAAPIPTDAPVTSATLQPHRSIVSLTSSGPTS